MNPITEKQSGKIILIASLVVLALFGIRTVSHYSIWSNLLTGKTVITSGIPQEDTLSIASEGLDWTASSWLYDTGAYLLWQAGGAGLLTLIQTLLVAGAFLLLWQVARRYAGPLSCGTAMLLCVWLMSPRFILSPSVAVLILAAGLIYIMSRPALDARHITAGLLLYILWVNMHPSFTMGLIIAALYAAEAFIVSRGGTAAPLKPRLIILLGMLPCTLINPYLTGIIAEGLSFWHNPTHVLLQDWISPFTNLFAQPGSALITIVLLLGALGLLALKERLPFALTAIGLLGAFLIIRMQTNLEYVEFFTVLVLPFLAISLEAIGKFINDRFLARSPNQASLVKIYRGAYLFAAAASAFLIVTGSVYAVRGSAARFGLGTNTDMVPAAAQANLEGRLPGMLLHLPMDGAYITLTSEKQNFIDQRTGISRQEAYEQLLGGLLMNQEESWESLLNEYNPGGILINLLGKNGAVAAARLLADQNNWALAYFDGTSALLLRKLSFNQALIQDSELKSAGLELIEKERQQFKEKVTGAFYHGTSARLIGAARLYMALNRFEEAEAVYGLLVRGAPTMLAGWFNLGICQLNLGRVDAAVESLEAALDLAPRGRKAYAYLQLHQAYKRGDYVDEAAWALEKAQQLNPKLTAAFTANAN